MVGQTVGKSFSIVNAYSCNRVQPSLGTLFEIANRNWRSGVD